MGVCLCSVVFEEKTSQYRLQKSGSAPLPPCLVTWGNSLQGLHNIFFLTFQLLCAKFLTEKYFMYKSKLFPRKGIGTLTIRYQQSHWYWLFFLQLEASFYLGELEAGFKGISVKQALALLDWALGSKGIGWNSQGSLQNP